MIITKELQEAWVNAYVKEKHTVDECIGFLDGINKALEFVNKNLDKTFDDGYKKGYRDATNEMLQI